MLRNGSEVVVAIEPVSSGKMVLSITLTRVLLSTAGVIKPTLLSGSVELKLDDKLDLFILLIISCYYPNPGLKPNEYPDGTIFHFPIPIISS